MARNDRKRLFVSEIAGSAEEYRTGIAVFAAHLYAGSWFDSDIVYFKMNLMSLLFIFCTIFNNYNTDGCFEQSFQVFF